MKIEKQILHYCLDKAKEFHKLGEPNKARDYCDMGIDRDWETITK